MAINRVYAPPLRGLANIAAAAGNADMQLQYDQLRQRDRLARMQLQGQYDQQRIQNQSNMDRMVLGAQLQGQQNAQQNAYNRADYQDRFAREMQARQQMDQQNAAQAQALQQGNQAFQVGRDEASLAAQQARDEMQARNAMLMQQEAERQKRQASEEYQKNVVERLNPQGQAQMSAAQKKRADAERVYGQRQISFETYQDQLREANQMEQSLNDPQYLIPQGSRPGDIIEKEGLFYKTNKDGIQEVDGISNFQEYAKSKGQVIGYLGDEPLYSVTLPSRGGSIRPPVVDPRVEMVESEKKRYATEVKEIRSQNMEHRKAIGDYVQTLLKQVKKDGVGGETPLYTPAEAERKAREFYGPEDAMPSWSPPEITKLPTSELDAEKAAAAKQAEAVRNFSANDALSAYNDLWRKVNDAPPDEKDALKKAAWDSEMAMYLNSGLDSGKAAHQASLDYATNPSDPAKIEVLNKTHKQFIQDLKAHAAAVSTPTPTAIPPQTPQAIITPKQPQEEGWLPWGVKKAANYLEKPFFGTTQQMGIPGPSEALANWMFPAPGMGPRVETPPELAAMFKDRSPQELDELSQQIPIANSAEEFQALKLPSGSLVIVNGKLKQVP